MQDACQTVRDRLQMSADGSKRHTCNLQLQFSLRAAAMFPAATACYVPNSWSQPHPQELCLFCTAGQKAAALSPSSTVKPSSL
jgi:hypothetical protein